MDYISPRDYDYIKNKYHDSKKPWDGTRRFIRKDELFSKETGIDADEICKRVMEQDEQLKDFPHPIRKARALEFILENTRISCDFRDRYPAINVSDRPIEKTVVSLWRREVFGEIIPEVEEKRQLFERLGIVTIWADYDHSMPIWERVLSLGFSGLLEECEKARAERKLTEDEDAFFEGIRITYTAIINFLGRLAELAEKTPGSERMAKALRSIQNGAPKTFYEALLLNFLYFFISEHIDGLQVRSLGNFDRIFAPFYEADIARGVSREEIKEDIAYFLMQFVAIGNYWNQPVYLGGENEDGSSLANELSYTFLEVYRKMNTCTPKIQIKITESTPRELVCLALDLIRHGNNSIVFVNDTNMQRALIRAGIPKEEARLCHVTGCYEYQPQDAYLTGMNYFNLLKPLEYALHEGFDPLSKQQTGIKCPPPSSFKSFDEFLLEYERQLLHVIDKTIEVVNGFEDYLAYINPLSMLSATFPSAVAKAKDAIGGGAKYNNTMLSLGGLADVGDSLLMIKKYVYDKKLLTLSELVAILDKNFEGEERLRLTLLRDREKYGNNIDSADAMTLHVANFCIDNIYGRKNSNGRGGKWLCSFHVARFSYRWADKTAACPNGRKHGEELSKNLSPTLGQARSGSTATVLSFTKLDQTKIPANLSLDLAFLPSSVKGDDGLMAMYGLLMTFVKRGGHAAHFNVFDAEMLRDAQAHPDKYADLQIRISGWNVLWNNIDKSEQEGFIRQAEALS